LILSKVVIAITLAVAASALAASPAGGGTVPGNEAQLGTLLTGTIVFLLAAFAPFLLLRLFPAVEAATVARGISRAPARATQTALLSALTVTRLAGVAQGATPAASGKATTPITASPDAASARPGAPGRTPQDPTRRRALPHASRAPTGAAPGEDEATDDEAW
ncbi:MAG TPA: hypothetical protein VN180_01825, partial [Acidimicrobiia bacterium]|nr:hypothetical protein [Acidimicrobiia bacterium]